MTTAKSEIETLLNGSIAEGKEALKQFNENNAATFNFSFLDFNSSRKRLLDKLFDYLQSNDVKDIHRDCLIAVRILSRDKKGLDNILDLKHIDLLKICARLDANCLVSEDKIDYELEIEAQKCLCNIIYNSPVAAAYCSKNGTMEGVIERIKNHKRFKRVPLDIKIFDMKILFLITALCEETRPKLKEDLHGLKYLTEVLEQLIMNDKEFEQSGGATSAPVQKKLLKEELNYACEVLKVLFNLTVSQNLSSQPDEEEESKYKELVEILREMLVTKIDDQNSKLELINNIVNLITNMPTSTYNVLHRPVKDEENISKKLQFDGQDMRAINEILVLLENKFSKEIAVRSQSEILSPILTVLVKAVSSDRYLRKYLRQKILPPLRDVHSRPEEGNTLRNNLCRLLTTTITHVRDLAADLLFILCKENVGRMIKYTGYGNAAGLFANRGLLGGGRPEERRYSSESENSDTEEYREHKHGINPVIGCYEQPKASPMANMTEEQKEYEAMKLVDLMDSLTRTGIIQPCKIGEDGRPEPIEHVLQLQEGLPAQQVRRNQDDN